MHYGSPSEKMQALCEIKAYFRLVFTQKTDDFTRFVNDCSIKVGYCISEGEFAAIVRLFSFVTDRLTFLKCIRKYLFNLKIWKRKFDSLDSFDSFGTVSGSSCFLLTRIKVLVCWVEPEYGSIYFLKWLLMYTKMHVFSDIRCNWEPCCFGKVQSAAGLIS